MVGPGWERTVPASALRLSAGGWQGRAVHLLWDEGDHVYAVTVSEPGAVEALSGHLPGRLADEVRGLAAAAVRSTRRRTRRTAIVASVILLTPLLLLLLLYLFRGQVIDAVVRRLPTSVDAQIGTLLLGELQRSGRLVEGGPGPEAVQGIGRRLLQGAAPNPHEFRFAVLRDPSVNAFAAPGGVIVVHTGLLAASDGPDALAGVLAHEITHVLHRHTVRQLVFRAGLAGAAQLLIGSPDGAAEMLGSTAFDLGSLGFSREQERDADEGGLLLLQRALLPGEGLVRFFEVLQAQGGGPPALLSSHPPAADRSAALRAEIARRGAWPVEPLTVDWAAVQAQAAAAPAVN